MGELARAFCSTRVRYIRCGALRACSSMHACSSSLHAAATLLPAWMDGAPDAAACWMHVSDPFTHTAASYLRPIASAASMPCAHRCTHTFSRSTSQHLAPHTLASTRVVPKQHIPSSLTAGYMPWKGAQQAHHTLNLCGPACVGAHTQSHTHAQGDMRKHA